MTANPQTKAYGNADPVFTFTSTPSLIGNDTFSGSLGRAAGETVAGSPYPIQQGTLALNGNYTVTYTGANLTISRAPASVSPAGTGKVYGSPDPPITGALTGFLATDKVTATYTRRLGESVVGGPYQISGTLGPITVLDNYSITYNSADFSISPKGVTVGADPNGKIYGNPDPPLTATYSGCLLGDVGPGKITFGATRAAGENVQNYDITPTANDNGTGLLANYQCQYTRGNFTISKAQLTVIADNKSRLRGAANPLLTASFDGLASFDTVASLGGVPSLTTLADAISPKGSYPIVASLGSLANPNYSYTFVDGLLTVTGPAPQTISFDPLRPKTFGDGDFDPGATASSGLSVDYLSSVPGTATVVGRKIRVVAPGTTDLTASQAGDDNYDPALPVVRTLTVNPPPWNGLGFDGMADLVRVADAPQLNFGTKDGFSIEVWLHLDGSQPDGTGLVSKGADGSAWSGYQLILYGDRIAAEIGGDGAGIGVPDGLIGTSSLNDGAWHHVALSVDRTSATAALYLDGRLEALVANPALGVNPDNTAALQVGIDRSGSRFFKGAMDELRLWDMARSRDQIRAQASQIVDPPDEPHLAAYFHFDEGDAGLNNASFTSAPERTANGANGALQGFALSGNSSNWVRSDAFLPLLETTPITSNASGGATGGGVVYPNYYPATDVGLCWGSAPNPGLTDTCSHSGSGTGPFVGSLTGLTPGSGYHLRGFATNQMGTAYGNDLSFQAARLEQTVGIGAIADRTYGDAAFDPGGTSSSGLPVSYSSSNPAVAVVVDGRIVITGAGSTVITASQAGDGSYAPAVDASQPFKVAKAPLAVTADNKTRAYQTPNPALTASYSGFVNGDTPGAIAGVPALATDASQASPAGTYPIVTGLGSLFSQNYLFLLGNGTLSVFKSCQEIIFPALGERTFGDAPVQLVASSCSGLGISFTSSNPQVAQVNGNLLTITGAGSVVVTASQGGNGNLNVAPDVSQSVIVHKSGQLLSFPSLSRRTLGDPPFNPNATASSGLPVSYLSSDPDVASVSGGLVTIVGAGTTVISAIQNGDGNYNPALPASQPLTVALETVPPFLTISTLSSGSVTADPVLNVAGAASDASGIASLTVNGTDLTDQAAQFSGAIPLGAGVNSISVVARDAVGNRTQQTVSVTFDATVPAIAVGTPADNSVASTPPFTANGTVAPGTIVTMSVNGGPSQVLVVSDGTFTGSGSFAAGMNTIEWTASRSGLSSRVKRSVMLALGKPSLAITDPAEDLRTEEDSVTIVGTAGADGVSVTIEAAGSVYTPSLQGGTFRQQIPLSGAGQIRVTARATDGAGNTSIAQRNVIRVNRIMGDLNGDGCVDIQDAMALLRISLGLDPVTPQALAHGDVAPLVNGVPQPDGTIDVGDVLVLLRKIVGLVDF